MTGRTRVAALFAALAVGCAGCGGGGGGSTATAGAGDPAPVAGGHAKGRALLTELKSATTSTAPAATAWCVTGDAAKLSAAANDARSAAAAHDLGLLRTAARQAVRSLRKVPEGTGCAGSFLDTIAEEAKKVSGGRAVVTKIRQAQAAHRLPLHPY